MNQLWIEIGDHSIRINSQSEQAIQHIVNGFKVVPTKQSKKANLDIVIEYGYGYPFNGFDVDITKDNGTVFYDRGDYIIEVDLNYTSANIKVLNDFALKHALMNLYSVFIVHEQWGLLIHSSCMREGNKAYLFSGQSGAGKSTVVELSYPRAILSDEATVVKITSSGTKVYDSPFRSDTTSFFQEPSIELGGIQLLEQSENINRFRLEKSESMMSLFDKVFYWASDPVETKKIFELLSQLVSDVPVYRLQFQKNNLFWKEIS